MEKHLIRTEIMNMTVIQWQKIKDIEKVGFIEITVKELIDLVGFNGGMFFSNKANELELTFINEFYNYGRVKRKYETDLTKITIPKT